MSTSTFIIALSKLVIEHIALSYKSKFPNVVSDFFRLGAML